MCSSDGLNKAIRNNNEEVLELLITHGIECTEEHLLTAICVQNIGMVNKLLKHGIKCTEEHVSQALSKNNAKIFKLLLQHTNYKCTEDYLLLAIFKNNLEIVKALLEKQVNCTSKCLYAAFQEGERVKIAKLLVRHKVQLPESKKAILKAKYARPFGYEEQQMANLLNKLN